MVPAVLGTVAKLILFVNGSGGRGISGQSKREGKSEVSTDLVLIKVRVKVGPNMATIRV